MEGGFLSLSESTPSLEVDQIGARRLSSLPVPRERPLLPGGRKESELIGFVDAQLMKISRKYVNRFNTDPNDDRTDVTMHRGYWNFEELAYDLERTIDIVWVSNSPNLQIPYLLNIALTACTALDSFNFAPFATFHLLDKLDLAFCALLLGSHDSIKDLVPGFSAGRGAFNDTTRVRLRGIISRTRLMVVTISSRSPVDREVIPDQLGQQRLLSQASENDDLSDTGNEEDYNDVELCNMSIARVYERTLMAMGEGIAF